MAKCNLGKVNLEPMRKVVSVICGVATRACLAMCLHVKMLMCHKKVFHVQK